MAPTLLLPAVNLLLPSYVVALVAAVVVCHTIGPWWAERLVGIQRRMSRRALIVAGIGAFVGGRVHFVASHWQLFAAHPLDALRFWNGVHAAGAILGAVVTLAVAARRTGLSAWRLADGLAPTIGIGIAIARLGCFLHGCCFGVPCRLPWCVTFPSEAYVSQMHASLGLVAAAGRSAPVHPLQLYFAGLGLLVTAAALRVHRRRHVAGEPTLVALLVFSAGAAALELLRGERVARVYWGPLPQLEWIALGMTVGAAVALVVCRRAARDP